MDKSAKYRNLIKKLLTKYAKLIEKGIPSSKDTTVVFDEVHDHYLLLTMGWRGYKRIKGYPLHVRLHDGKFWIEEDGLEKGIATDLLEAGVPKEDIVLAFHHPEMRPLTEFAVA